MSLIVEFELDTPILRTASRAVEQIRHEEVYGTETGGWKLLFCAHGDDFEAFESALTDDPSVGEYALLEELTNRHLYSVVLTEEAAERLTYPVAAEHDVVVLEIVVTNETVVRAKVPSREALTAYRDGCLEKGVGFRIKRLYHEEQSNGERYGVTDRQREVLRTALDAGYFDVPREATLSSIADEFDISDQALSACLRRGQAALLKQTLVDDTPT
ncbi:helix-turn-helix domain-containing protein [Natrialbaceae archaeon A-arb3/5]